MSRHLRPSLVLTHIRVPGRHAPVITPGFFYLFLKVILTVLAHVWVPMCPPRMPELAFGCWVECILLAPQVCRGKGMIPDTHWEYSHILRSFSKTSSGFSWHTSHWQAITHPLEVLAHCPEGCLSWKASPNGESLLCMPLTSPPWGGLRKHWGNISGTSDLCSL